MNITEIKSARAGDSYFKIKHSSGLVVYVYPKEGYRSAYAIIGTKFGSINNCFSLDDGEKISVPDGIALEIDPAHILDAEDVKKKGLSI